MYQINFDELTMTCNFYYVKNKSEIFLKYFILIKKMFQNETQN